LPATPVAEFDVLAERDGLIPPTPNVIRVSPFENVLEHEPNGDLAHATLAEAELPIALNGIISRAG